MIKSVKRIISIIILVAMSLMLFSGCTSSAGISLAKALAKQADVKCFEFDSEVNLSVDIDSPSIQENIGSQIAVDMFRNVKIKAKGASDSELRRQMVTGEVKLNGITAEYESYLDKELMWIKYPVLSKYLSIDMSSTDTEIKEKYDDFQKKFTEIFKEFLKDYILGFKYDIEQIKDNGKVSITTESGNLSATEIAVVFDEKQAQEWISCAAKDIANKEGFINAVMDAIELIDEKASDNEMKTLKEDIKRSLTQFGENIDFSLDEAFKYIKFGETGLAFKFYIDSNGDIIRTLADMDLKITDPNFVLKTNDVSSNKEGVEIKLSARNDFKNINVSKEIKFPKFDTENTININELEGMENFNINPMKATYDMLNRYKDKLAKERTSTFNLDSKFGQIKGQFKALRRAPYEKDGTVYVSARDLADAIGINVEGNGEKIRFYDDNSKELTLYINSSKVIADGNESTYYFAPEIQSGFTMVDYLVVTDHFKDYIEKVDKEDLKYNQRVKIISIRD